MLQRLRDRSAPSTASHSATASECKETMERESATLFARMAAGDESAAMRLYELYSPLLFGLALAMMPEPAEAEAVVVDTFAIAWAETQRFDCSGGAVLAWLTTITRHRAISRIRARPVPQAVETPETGNPTLRAVAL